MSVEVTRTYLQMTSPSQHLRAPAPATPARVERAVSCPASFYRFLYTEIGRRYHWVDRLSWADSEILAHLSLPNISLWILYVEGSPAGFYELRRCEDDSTEIAYFGLMQEFLGKGLGKFLLSDAVDRAWSGGPESVWLHTCTLDDAAALPNYLSRGFTPFKQETYLAEW